MSELGPLSTEPAGPVCRLMSALSEKATVDRVGGERGVWRRARDLGSQTGRYDHALWTP
jgi:hypothetical protein